MIVGSSGQLSYIVGVNVDRPQLTVRGNDMSSTKSTEAAGNRIAGVVQREQQNPDNNTPAPHTDKKHRLPPSILHSCAAEMCIRAPI